MNTIKVAFLFDRNSSVRERLMIIEGLNEHPRITPYYNNDDYILGTQVASACDDIYDAIDKADLIFRLEVEHFQDKELQEYADKETFCSKTVYLDFLDSPEVNEYYLKHSLAYYKRSWPLSGVKIHPMSTGLDKVYPITYAALNVYFILAAKSTTHSVGCFFNESSLGRRKQLRNAILSFDWKNTNSIFVGTTTDCSQAGRQTICDAKENNPWYDYLEQLNSVKVVCTALPHHWDGDSRTWEALASNALVCMDGLAVPIERKIVHKKHALVTDFSDAAQTKKTLQTVKTLLEKHPKKLEKLAQRSRLYTYNYHRGINRVNSILTIAQKSMNQFK